MLPLGPITKAYLEDTEKDFHSWRTESGHFRADVIHEIWKRNNNNTRRELVKPFFTMRDYEFRDYVSLKQIYMNSVDEFDCAMKAFGSWDFWLYLCKNPAFLNGTQLRAQWTGILNWREEKRLMEQNAAKKIIIDLAAKGNFAAAKMLFDNTTVKDSVGRPSQEKVLERVTKLVEEDTKVKEDMRRIRLAINNDTTKKNKRTATTD